MLTAAVSLIFNEVRIQMKGQARSELTATYAAEMVWTLLLGAALLAYFCGIQFLLELWYAEYHAIDWASAWQWTVGAVAVTTAYFAGVHAVRFIHVVFSRSS